MSSLVHLSTRMGTGPTELHFQPSLRSLKQCNQIERIVPDNLDVTWVNHLSAHENERLSITVSLTKRFTHTQALL